MKSICMSLALISSFMICQSSQAQGQGSGPVAINCSTEMEKICAGKEHEKGEMRECLMANIDKVSKECRTALETTGPKKGKGKGKGKKAK